MSCPTVDQANKQSFVVNIGDSEVGKLVVWWRERDKNPEFVFVKSVMSSSMADSSKSISIRTWAYY